MHSEGHPVGFGGSALALEVDGVGAPDDRTVGAMFIMALIAARLRKGDLLMVMDMPISMMVVMSRMRDARGGCLHQMCVHRAVLMPMNHQPTAGADIDDEGGQTD